MGADCQSTFCAQEGDRGIPDVVCPSITGDGGVIVGIQDRLAVDRIWVDNWGWQNLMTEFNLRVSLVSSPLPCTPFFPILMCEIITR